MMSLQSNLLQILPSDKNVFIVNEPLAVDGTFSIDVPYTDVNYRLKKMTVDFFTTTEPFLPTNVQKFYGSSDNVLSENQRKFFMLDLNVKDLGDTFLRKNYKQLLPTAWRTYSQVKDVYNSGSAEDQTGVQVNADYMQKAYDTFYEKVGGEVDLNDYFQVFAEIGNRVTTDDLLKPDFEISNFDMDMMRIYFFHKSFFFPQINQTDTANGGVTLEVGTIPTLSYDSNLRSGVRFVLLDINRGDYRSVLTESKRSVYLEYTVTESEKDVTKYLWVFTLANPLSLHTKKFGDKYYYLSANLTDLKDKIAMYGRNETEVNFIGVSMDGRSGWNDSFNARDLLCDMGFGVVPASRYDDGKENMLFTVFRSNFAYVLGSSLSFFAKSRFEPPKLQDGLVKNIDDEFVENYASMCSDDDLLSVICGLISAPNVLISNIRNITLYAKPSNTNSFYGNDFILKLVCYQGESSVVGGRKRQRVERVLGLFKANDVTYQQFLGADDKVIVQPPTFRPLSFANPESTYIIRDSSRKLQFKILNIDDEEVKFTDGDRVIMHLTFEAFDFKQ